MTTSFNLTRNQIAARVLGKVINIGAATPVSADAETVYQAIDLRLKEIHKLGIFWRKVTTVPVTFSLAADVPTASAGAGDILFPILMTFTNGSLDDPVEIIGKVQYAAIADKTRTGDPEKALWKGGSEFIFHPVPGADGTAKLLYEKIADDSSAGAVIDIEVSMIRCMIDLVKFDVADDFGIDEVKMNRWSIEATKAERDIRKLGAQRITSLLPVAVDNFDDRQPDSRRDSDY